MMYVVLRTDKTMIAAKRRKRLKKNTGFIFALFVPFFGKWLHLK